MPSAGRKFLLAGRGGLNLTHSEPLEPFLNRYGATVPLLRAAIAAFPPGRVRAWCEELGQPTFVGSSGRVFPRALKTSPLLRAWLRRLDRLGVTFMPRHRWTGWDGDALTFETPQGRVAVTADVTVLALGGASWPQLGSDGGWVPILTRGRHRGDAVAAGELRLHGRLVGAVSRAFPGPSAQAHRAVVRRPAGARRSRHHGGGHRGRGGLRAVGAAARGDRGAAARPCCTSTCGRT